MNIELTEEQYIDSIQSLLEDFLRAHADQFSFVSDKAVYEFIEDYKTLLTTTQIQQLCERHGGSFVQWNEFDEDDKSTWPKYSQSVMCDAFRDVVGFSRGKFYSVFMQEIENVEHWCELPTP